MSIKCMSTLQYTSAYKLLHHIVIVVVRIFFLEVRFPLDGHLGLLLHLRAHLNKGETRNKTSTTRGTESAREYVMHTTESPLTR